MHERHVIALMFVSVELHVLIVLYDTNDIVDTSDIVETVLHNEPHQIVHHFAGLLQ